MSEPGSPQAAGAVAPGRARRELMLSYVIVTRNRRDDFKECLLSAQSQRYRPREIIAVDNASDDGTSEMVAATFPDISYLRLPENRGPTGARNEGIRRAQGDVIVLLDDDAAFTDEDNAARIAAAFEGDPHLGILAARIVDGAGRVRRKDFPALRKTSGLERFETTYFVGAGAAIRAELLARTGLFAEHWLFGAEELDLSFRVMQTPYRIEYRPEVVVHHKGSVRERPASRRFYYQTRNRLWLVLRYLPLPMATVHFGLWSARMIAWGMTCGQLPAVLCGLRDALRGAPRAWRERKVLSYSALQRMRALRGRLWF